MPQKRWKLGNGTVEWSLCFDERSIIRTDGTDDQYTLLRLALKHDSTTRTTPVPHRHVQAAHAMGAGLGGFVEKAALDDLEESALVPLDCRDAWFDMKAKVRAGTLNASGVLNALRRAFNGALRNLVAGVAAAEAQPPAPHHATMPAATPAAMHFATPDTTPAARPTFGDSLLQVLTVASTDIELLAAAKHVRDNHPLLAAPTAKHTNLYYPMPLKDLAPRQRSLASNNRPSYLANIPATAALSNATSRLPTGPPAAPP